MDSVADFAFDCDIIIDKLENLLKVAENNLIKLNRNCVALSRNSIVKFNRLAFELLCCADCVSAEKSCYNVGENKTGFICVYNRLDDCGDYIVLICEVNACRVADNLENTLTED